MTSLLFRNLIFTVLQPGVVAFLIPYLIVRKDVRSVLAQPVALYQFLGLLLVIMGLIILLTCIYFFAAFGKGTLSPADPTKNLVMSGFYRYSRNPMYLAVTTILLGETILMRSFALGVYTVFVMVAFYLFVVFFEEPRLQREFGDEYAKYRKKVRRWI